MRNRWIALSVLVAIVVLAAVLAAADESSPDPAGQQEAPSPAEGPPPTVAPSVVPAPVPASVPSGSEPDPGAAVPSTVAPVADDSTGIEPLMQPKPPARLEPLVPPAPLGPEDRPVGPLNPDIDKTVPPPRY